MTTSPLANSGQLSIADQLLFTEIKKRNMEGRFFTPNEVSVRFAPDVCFLSVDNYTLDPNDILLVRLTRGETQRAFEIASVFESLGGKVSDPANSLRYAGSKLLPYIKRNDAIKFIPSYFFNSSKTSLKDILEIISYPFILKPQMGFRGIGVTLIHTEEDFNEYLRHDTEKDLIAQTYVEITEEFRVVTIGGKGLGVVLKKRNTDISFSADMDIDVAVDEPEILRFAEHAAQLEDADVYGADIARNKAGELFLIENNRCPNFITFREATGIPVEEKIIDFLLH